MPSRRSHPELADATGPLKGWTAIAGFLKMPVTTARKWAQSGMPVKREGRYIVADPEQLREWLGREAGMRYPTVIATNTSDLTAGLKRSIAEARKKTPKSR